MVIKKAKANYHNGTGYDVLHYETQLKQVKVIDVNGVVAGDLEAELIGIKSSVTAVDDRVDSTDTDVSGIKTDIGTVSTLTTVAKKVVPAINEVRQTAETNKSDIANLSSTVSSLQSSNSNHNHDTVYLKLSGGSLTGDTSVANNKGFLGKNTSGVSLNIGRVNTTNDVVLGDLGAKALIQATNGDVKVSDGTTTHKVWHAGNVGSGSGLNADMVDGIHASTFARQDVKPVFSAGAEIGSGTSLVLKASSGSSDAGDVVFQAGDGVEMGRITSDVNGSIKMSAKGVNGLTLRADGFSYTEYGMEFNSKSRETQVIFKKDDTDEGTGLFMNKERNEFGQYDWAHNRYVYKYDRANNNFNFSGSISIQNHKVSIQSVAPSSPAVGDIWINI